MKFYLTLFSMLASIVLCTFAIAYAVRGDTIAAYGLLVGGIGWFIICLLLINNRINLRRKMK